MAQHIETRILIASVRRVLQNHRDKQLHPSKWTHAAFEDSLVDLEDLVDEMEADPKTLPRTESLIRGNK